MDAWVKKFIGIPYVSTGRELEGCDCWGLVRLIQKEVFNREVPIYGNEYYTDSDNRDDVAPFVQVVKSDYLQVEWTDRREGDILVLNLAGYPVHVGTILDSDWMIHTLRDRHSYVEKYSRPVWNRRIEGVYRWLTK